MRSKAFGYLISCAAAVTMAVLAAPAAQADTAVTTTVGATTNDDGDSWGWD
ncbi:hypothetical protein [Streptomyces vilmorinianum]|uniref:hypothetical protein n=1 Tax=Streptomyces vilmorinianum TaxID=3051092 RepID=UPI001586270F|nr:hypothetical protein [Streptomyces vilmorinianum]